MICKSDRPTTFPTHDPRHNAAANKLKAENGIFSRIFPPSYALNLQAGASAVDTSSAVISRPAVFVASGRHFMSG